MARKKILLVDDAETILMMERMFLQKGPYDLVTAKNGEEAVEKAVAERPDLILLDIMMPKMDGLRPASSSANERKPRPSPSSWLPPGARRTRCRRPTNAGAPITSPNLLAAWNS